MGLRDLANSMSATINPNVLGRYLESTGSTTADSGKQSPSWATPVEDVPMQVQALTSGDLKHLDSLNIQNVERIVFMDGAIAGVNRLAGKGGDMLYFLSAWWLVTVVLEPWDGSGWCKLGVTQQVEAPI